VRAAEDGRTGPLPTLEEAIAMLPKIGSSTYRVDHENKGDDMGTKRDKQAADYRAEERERDARTSTPGEGSRAVQAASGGGEQPRGWLTGEELEAVEYFSRFVDEHIVPQEWIAMAGRLRNLLARATAETALKAASSGEDRAYADKMACDEERDFANRILDERDAAIREREDLREQLESVACRAATAETALKAASSGEEPEPVAWMCEWTDHTSIYQSRIYAESAADGEVVVQPLYRSPPQPRGWLSEEERDFLDHHRHECAERASTFSNARAIPWVNRVKLIDDLLARSTPPEVVLPFVDPAFDEIARLREERRWVPEP
jgi:hypothetical protein